MFVERYDLNIYKIIFSAHILDTFSSFFIILSCFNVSRENFQQKCFFFFFFFFRKLALIYHANCFQKISFDISCILSPENIL